MQQIAPLPFGYPEFTGAHVRHRQAPMGAAALQHHGAEPVVAAGAEQALLQHRAGGEHAGDVALEQRAFGRRGFQLVAEGHAEAAAHQLGAVALGGVVGDAGHGHTANRFAGFFAGEGQLQQTGELDRVLKEALEEVAQAVEQHPLGMGRLELHVVAQHRGELLRVHQAVVVPGGKIAVDRSGCGVRSRFVSGVDVCGRGLGSCLVAPLARPPFGVGDQLFRSIPVSCGLRGGLRAEPCSRDAGLGLRSAEQVALKGDQGWLLGRRGHGSAGRGA